MNWVWLGLAVMNLIVAFVNLYVMYIVRNLAKRIADGAKVNLDQSKMLSVWQSRLEAQRDRSSVQ